MLKLPAGLLVVGLLADECRDCLDRRALQENSRPCKTYDLTQRNAVSKIKRDWSSAESGERTILLESLLELPAEHGGLTSDAIIRAYSLAARDTDAAIRARGLELLADQTE